MWHYITRSRIRFLKGRSYDEVNLIYTNPELTMGELEFLKYATVKKENGFLKVGKIFLHSLDVDGNQVLS